MSNFKINKKKFVAFEYLRTRALSNRTVKIMSITYALMIYPGDVDQTRVAERRQHPQPPYVYIFLILCEEKLSTISKVQDQREVNNVCFY